MKQAAATPAAAASLAGVDRIELMQTFVRIVEAGNLSAAAQQLGTSQPTVSRRLQALERSLGLKLLQRSTHVMKLTEDGERCFAHAKALLDDWRAMEADLRGAHDAPRGTLRVLVPHAFGQEQLIAPLVKYLREYPEVSVEWLLHDRRPDFIAEGIDCAIQVGAVDDPSVVAIHLAEVPRIVVAAPDLLPGGTVPEHASALRDLPWVALRTYYQREVSLTRVPDGVVERFAIHPRMGTDSLYALRSAALAGLGAAVASAWAVEADLRQGRLRHLAPAWQAAPLPVYLVYPHARFYPARLRRFLDAMRAALPTLAGMRAPGGDGWALSGRLA
ncbi:LysR family transcriptional regulator [Acidovorax sp. NCPPB 3576]|uniref:LysR family transcriptional regulator n=1 Tax=Acidovorax sp. NCPPB 3576 TaxID=2940488 RepID=UPI00234BEACC|nr:LysR family transcriptional regulator [Acidovorax sp. NCPPB 3576]WCM86263.1 LysR substrate-binding domain-containing protein [Acidovorax sp. NCPPB 3576]